MHNPSHTYLWEGLFLIRKHVSFIGGYCIISNLNWQTAVFFCFSFLYGIISIDFKELKLAKV